MVCDEQVPRLPRSGRLQPLAALCQVAAPLRPRMCLAPLRRPPQVKARHLVRESSIAPPPLLLVILSHAGLCQHGGADGFLVSASILAAA
jgi:hypothetical protein